MSIKGALKIIPNKIREMLEDYSKDLEEAWVKSGEEPLNISFSVKIGVSRGKNSCDVGILFTKEKIKDLYSFYWDANQGELFDSIEKMDADLKKEYKSLIFSMDGHEPVILGADLPDLDKKGYMKKRQ